MPDTLSGTSARPTPALSATSDMPEVEGTTAAAAQAPKPKAAPAAKPEPAPEPEAPAIDHDAIARDRAMIAEAQDAAAKDPRPAAPVRAKYDDPDSYDAALSQHQAELVEWALRNGQRKTAAEAAAKRIHAANQREAETLAASWNRSMEAAREAKPDFDKVALREDVHITPSMGMAIMNASNGPLVAYHLGENPKEAARIARLSAAAQAVEIGRLSAKLGEGETTKPAPRRSAAPRSTAPKAETMEQYAARRLGEIKAERESRGARR